LGTFGTFLASTRAAERFPRDERLCFHVGTDQTRRNRPKRFRGIRRFRQCHAATSAFTRSTEKIPPSWSARYRSCITLPSTWAGVPTMALRRYATAVEET